MLTYAAYGPQGIIAEESSPAHNPMI